MSVAQFQAAVLLGVVEDQVELLEVLLLDDDVVVVVELDDVVVDELLLELPEVVAVGFDAATATGSVIPIASSTKLSL